MVDVRTSPVPEIGRSAVWVEGAGRRHVLLFEKGPNLLRSFVFGAPRPLAHPSVFHVVVTKPAWAEVPAELVVHVRKHNRNGSPRGRLDDFGNPSNQTVDRILGLVSVRPGREVGGDEEEVDGDVGGDVELQEDVEDLVAGHGARSRS